MAPICINGFAWKKQWYKKYNRKYRSRAIPLHPG